MAKEKVVMAMSGGVDSSVAAALLVEQGYEVIGITMRLWSPGNSWELGVEGGCCSLSAVEDARRVADKIGVPYYVMNFSDNFKETVVDYFVDEYSRGRTPNPCIACNRYLKFDLLLEKAHALGARYVATGHYARKAYDNALGRYLLYTGIDDSKDQSYALYTLTQQQLEDIMFPLGDLTKTQVRELATRYELSTADKPESQEICFVPDDDYSKFWEEYTGKSGQAGPIKTVDGEILGYHEGIHNFTIGQRRGIGVAVGHPIYVVDILTDDNTVIVGESKDVFANGLIADDLNWIAIPQLSGSLYAQAKIRYAAKPKDCKIYPLDGERVRVVFDEPQRAITPGQAVVFYEGESVLGGGTIQQQLR